MHVKGPRTGEIVMAALVQSTWFPIIDRSPQKFVPNIFAATASDYQEATERVYSTPTAASYIELPVASQ